MSIIIWLIVGGLAGWLAGMVVKGGGFGLIGDIIVGIIGGLIAGWLLPRLGINIGSGFVAAVIERWPHVLLQWEDFAGTNAARLLERYRDRLCTFNDDIQGTAAVATATLLAAINVTGTPLKEQRIAMLGFGSAGVGIASLMVTAMVEAGLSLDEARGRVYAVDKDGLLVEGYPDLHPTQQPFVKKREAVAGWRLAQGNIGLLDVVKNVKPTVVIGVSGQPGVRPPD